MPEVVTVDEVVSARPATRVGGGLAARPVHDENITASTGDVKVNRSGIEDESHTHSTRRERVLKESTAKLLEKFEQEAQEEDADAGLAPHEEGDADEDEPAEEAADAQADDSDADPAADDAEPAEEAEEEKAPADDVVARLEARNRELLSELDTARKTPKVQRTERETAMMEAEAAYIDAGSIPALRKFLSVVTGAAVDSKEVDAELRGLFADLTAQELGVPLDSSQQALRDNARTRLLLARDRREKAEADKKPAVDNSADDVQMENAAKYIDNLLATKGQSGTSLVDEYPMLMELAQDFDGFKPSEVLARAIRQEIMTGTLDPTKTGDIDMIRAVAPKIEQHYERVAKRIEAARAKKNKKPDTTTTSSVKPKVAVEVSKEQRQSTGARTLTNAAASRAPATPPKTTKQPTKKTTTEKSRKDFKSDAEWREHLLSKHFQS